MYTSVMEIEKRMKFKFIGIHAAAPVAQGKKEDILAELHPRAKRTRVGGAP